MTLDNLVRKTVLRTARDFDNPSSPFLISNARHCYVYILACLSEITIKDCTDSFIVTGVARSVVIENCSRCIIISISKALKIQSSSELTIHTCVNTRPVMTMGNSNVILAPYNTYYSQLDSHIQEMDIKTGLKENLWSSPMDYNRARSVSLLIANKMPNTALLEEKVHTYSIMSPDEFTPFSVPFQLPGTTKANPIELPPEFTLSLQRRALSILDLKKQIEAVPDPNKEELKKMIEEKFRGWLVQSGNIDQVNDLINFHLQ